VVVLGSGETIPPLGLGTWHLAEDAARWRTEVTALRAGIDLGMSVIDTAELYGSGRSEELVGEAIAGRREDVFLVSKVVPDHATSDGTVAACEGSLRRLRTDHLDLYLLHWRGMVPLQETLAGFRQLQQAGKIRYWGVSNFDVTDMDELVTLGGHDVAADQVLYNLAHRGIEYDLLPWCLERDVAIMAYSPIEQGRLLSHPALATVAARHGATPAQVALAWVISRENVCAIPQAGTPAHVVENHRALHLKLDEEDLATLDLAFPVPTGRRPLEVI
jgi:diketogulonate reductase-like aldo/keto reductase